LSAVTLLPLSVLSQLLAFFKSQPAPALRLDDASFVDAYRRVRPPSAGDLLAELKNVALACASISAATCATSGRVLVAESTFNVKEVQNHRRREQTAAKE